MGDFLAGRSATEVAAFYRRLAQHVKTRAGGESLAAELLIHWLDGKGKQKTVKASYVQDVSFVKEYLQHDVRPVFLTEKKAQVKPRPIWAGIIPRISKIPPFHNKPGVQSGGPYPMMYEGPSVAIPLSVQAQAALGGGNRREVDLLYALHRFGLVSNVVATAAPLEGATYKVHFAAWKTKMVDTYDWDPTKHITVPNPDHRSKAPNAIAPSEPSLTVYHTHAIRVQNAGLAAPFDLESDEWIVTDQSIMGPGLVDTSRCRPANNGVQCS